MQRLKQTAVQTANKLSPRTTTRSLLPSKTPSEPAGGGMRNMLLAVLALLLLVGVGFAAQSVGGDGGIGAPPAPLNARNPLPTAPKYTWKNLQTSRLTVHSLLCLYVSTS